MQAEMDRLKADRDLARSQLDKEKADRAEALLLRRRAEHRPGPPLKSAEVGSCVGSSPACSLLVPHLSKLSRDGGPCLRRVTQELSAVCKHANKHALPPHLLQDGPATQGWGSLSAFRMASLPPVMQAYLLHHIRPSSLTQTLTARQTMQQAIPLLLARPSPLEPRSCLQDL